MRTRTENRRSSENPTNNAAHNSTEYRYAEVARRLAKQQQGSDGFMWSQLAALWDEVAKRIAAKEAQSASVQRERHVEEWDTGD